MEPPFPIPNKEVKHTSANNTCFARNREDRSRPGNLSAKFYMGPDIPNREASPVDALLASVRPEDSRTKKARRRGGFLEGDKLETDGEEGEADEEKDKYSRPKPRSIVSFFDKAKHHLREEDSDNPLCHHQPPHECDETPSIGNPDIMGKDMGNTDKKGDHS